jgi:hypothetical protein
MAGRPRLERFWLNGRWNELRDPDGPPTGRQLLWLNSRGLLELRGCDGDGPVTKGEAARAIDWARDADNPFIDHSRPRVHPPPRFDDAGDTGRQARP